MGVAAIVGGIGLLLSASQIGIGLSDKAKAKREADKLRANRVEITNPYSSLRPSTLGANLASNQSLRGLASQTEAASRFGSRGQAFLPQLARNNSLVNQQNAVGLDRQVTNIQQLQARGEIIRQNQELGIYNQEQAGYANYYNSGQANVMGGISNFAGTLASGFAQGGAFAGLVNNQPRPLQQAAFTAPTAGVQPFQPQGFQPAQITGFQPLIS